MRHLEHADATMPAPEPEPAAESVTDSSSSPRRRFTDDDVINELWDVDEPSDCLPQALLGDRQPSLSSASFTLSMVHTLWLVW